MPLLRFLRRGRRSPLSLAKSQTRVNPTTATNATATARVIRVKRALQLLVNRYG